MTKKRPTTIPEYIEAASAEAKPHLVKLYEILESVAPEAQHTIKWGNPFFVEPRFLFSFSAHKAHVSFATSNDALAPHREKLRDFEITKMGILKMPYSKPIPENLIKKIAMTRMKLVSERQDDKFW